MCRHAGRDRFRDKERLVRYTSPGPGSADPPMWVKGRKRTPMLRGAAETTGPDEWPEALSNYGLIYNDLGVTCGARLESPPATIFSDAKSSMACAAKRA